MSDLIEVSSHSDTPGFLHLRDPLCLSAFVAKPLDHQADEGGLVSDATTARTDSKFRILLCEGAETTKAFFFA